MYRHISILSAAVLLLSACTAQGSEVASFEECVAAGNPVMESYPRQCRAGDRLFVEEINEPVNTEE